METSTNLKKTVLHQEHLNANARMVGFGGWDMPVQYQGIRQEHLAVRNQAGLFDISHMGQLLVSGPQAASWLNELLSNQIHNLSPSQGQYTFLLNPQGGVIDDLYVFCLETERYLLIINASKIDEDLAWLQKHNTQAVPIESLSGVYAGLALQGPDAEKHARKLLGPDFIFPERNQIANLPEHDSWISRTGYTGEDGFEFFIPAQKGREWWNALLADGVTPCGLGSRDTLRLEVCYPLNGSDLSPEKTPLEAGLGFFVDLNKEHFIGLDVLRDQKAKGVPTRLVAFKMDGKTPPPRAHYPILHNGEVISEITSGTLSPSLDIGIGMAYLPTPIATPGTSISIDIRGKLFPATIQKKPLYKKS